MAVAEAGEPPCHQELPAAAASEGSLYELELELETEAGVRAGLDLHRGQPVLVAMFYASCTQACPMTIARIQGILSRLSPEDRSELHVLMVSFDPGRDTPTILGELHARHSLDERWTFARAPEEQVRELAAALEIKYRAQGDGEINHSTVVTLLDGHGVPRARVDSLTAPVDGLVEAIGEVAGS